MAVVSLLMTDIAGSTRLWASHPAEMRAALAGHDELLAAVVAHHVGTVFKHTGDGLCARFGSALDAVSAAVAAQAAISDAPWEGIGPLLVRMAVHVGEAEARGEDWFGPGLNRCARLLAIAHGGQIVVSEAAMSVLHDGPTEPLRFSDLGVHRLKDLAHPEHVWQAAGHGARTEFPPLRSLDSYRGNLPSQVTSFLGREAESSELAAALGATRLVTLVGPGGMGKTRLALQTAAGMIDKFAAGAWFVELAPIENPGAVDQAFVAALGLLGRAGVDPLDVVCDILQTWRALLVVDNCEHVLDRARRTVRTLLARCPDLSVVATSREPLRVDGEHVWTVGPLGDHAAQALFIERAGAANQALHPEHSADAVAAICRSLDRMPLAIELAAARARVLSAGEIAARLDQRFRLLTARRAEGRHASLQATLEWSYELLSPDEQALFDRLSVFVGGFNLAAAVAVAGGGRDELDVVDLLEGLVDKSLVNAEAQHQTTHYALLESMRQFGAERLDPAKQAALRLTHARHYADLVHAAEAGIRSPEQFTWVRRVRGEVDNIRVGIGAAVEQGDTDTAMRLAGGMLAYLWTRTFPEAAEWAMAALTLPDALTHPCAPRAELVRAWVAHQSGNPVEAEVRARAAQHLIDQLGLPHDPRVGCELLYALAFQRRFDEVEEIADATVGWCAEHGPNYDFDRCEADFVRAFDSVFAGQPHHDAARRAVAAAERADDPLSCIRARTLFAVLQAPTNPIGALALLEAAHQQALAGGLTYGYQPLTFAIGVQGMSDPYNALRRLPDLLAEERDIGFMLGLRALRSLIPVFSRVGCHDAVPIIDATSIPIVNLLVHQDVEEAMRVARTELGGDRYDELRADAANFDNTQLVTALTNLIAAIPASAPLPVGRESH